MDLNEMICTPREHIHEEDVKMDPQSPQPDISGRYSSVIILLKKRPWAMIYACMVEYFPNANETMLNRKYKKKTRTSTL